MGTEVRRHSPGTADALDLPAERARRRGLVPGRARADTPVAYALASLLDKIGLAGRRPEGIGRDCRRAWNQSEAAGGDFQPASPQSAAVAGERLAPSPAGLVNLAISHHLSAIT